MKDETKKKNTTAKSKSTANKDEKKVVSKSTTKSATKKATTTSKGNNKNVGTKKSQAAVNKKESVKKEEKIQTVQKKEIVKEEKNNKLVEKHEVKDNSAKMLFNNEIGSLLKIVLIIISIILIFLLITNVINGQIEEEKDLVTSNDIQYDEILVSNILKQKNSTYYVLVYEEDDNYYQTYNLYLSNYRAKENGIRFYTSKLTSGFNRNYFDSEKSNIVGSSIEDLKFKGTTLVKIENGSIVSAYEEPTTIIEHFKQIIG